MESGLTCCQIGASALRTSRPLRLEFSGAPYDVTARGGRRGWLEILGQVLERIDAKCFAFWSSLSLSGSDQRNALICFGSRLKQGQRRGLEGRYWG